ncbi:MAG: hypothetical protein DYH12_06405 [Sorangiineae bacterium PRO1]|nr:hypothetical protein [Sorangiineae bacterium PRO1]
MVSTPVVLSLVVIACAFAFGVIGARLRRDDIAFFVLLLVVTLLPAVWIPRFWRDIVVCGGIAALLWAVGSSFWDRLGWSAGVSVPLYLLSWIVPGGASVILTGLTLVGVWVSGHRSYQRLLRLRRATALDPNVQSDALVEIGGTVLPARVQSSLPNVDLSRAGGFRLLGNPEKLSQPENVELTTPAGLVLVQLASVELQDVRFAVPSQEHVAAWRTELGLDESTHPMLEVIDADELAYVIGTPTWTRASEGGGYRNTQMVPVFGKGSTLYQLSESEVDARTRWNLVLAVGFAVAAGAVGVTHAFGQ